MRKLLLALFILLTSTSAFAQLGNHNMILLAQRNQHPGTMGGRYSALWGYKAPNGREYAILGCNTGTAFVDITDSANIVEVDFLPGPSSNWREMKTYSHYAYIVSEASNSRLQIVDLQYLPDSVRLVTTWSYGNYSNTHSIQQAGPYLYLHGGNVTSGVGNNSGGITVVDVTNPIAPVRRGQWATEYVHDTRVIDDTIYAANIYAPPMGQGAIFVINAVNKDNLTTVSSWVNNPNPFPHNCDLTDNKKYIFTTDETAAPQPNGKLKIWDRTNINNVTFVRNWMPTNITTSVVHNVEIYGRYAVVAHYSAGVRVLDIIDPLNPVEIAWYDTHVANNNSNYDGCWGVYMFPSGKIIASDRDRGLYVLKSPSIITNVQGNSSIADSYKLNQNYPNPFNPSTTISFSIPKNSNVKLEVFNMNGKKVADVINDRRDAGNYDISFDASHFGLSSGTYFYKLTAGGFTETKKLTLVK